MSFSKVLLLSETDFRCVVLDLTYEVKDKKHCKELAEEIWEVFIESDKLDGLMVYCSNQWEEIYDIEKLAYIIEREF